MSNTTSDNRPDPDELLSSIQKKEEKSKRGKLKIFFGMCAGVGKTFAMIQEGIDLLNSGKKVVIGYSETHNRRETVELDYWLLHIPRKKIEYKSTILEEMDIDVIIEQKPDIVLVDELAHTNAPGSRHLKRYQDVLELLENGITVFTSLNVQHLESRSDAVREITGITVYETVPDSVFENSDEVELVDISPNELVKRLSEGKIYSPDKSQKAAENFFREGNLTALREMALRVVAERVDHQLRSYMQDQRIDGPWKSGERLMVNVRPGSPSEQLIRWTRRKAYSLEAKWIAVFIETKEMLSEDDRKSLTKNLQLAKELGAEILTTTDEDWISGLVRTARQENITQLIVAKYDQSIFSILTQWKYSINRLMNECGTIELQIISTGEEKKKSISYQNYLTIESSWNQYLAAIVIITVVSFICFQSTAILEYQAIGIILLFSVSLISLFSGRGPILLASALSAILWNFYFIPPLFTFAIHKLTDALMVGMYFIIAIITGIQTSRLRSKGRVVRQREERAIQLYSLSKELAVASSAEKVSEIAVEKIGQVFNAKVAVFLENEAYNLSDNPVLVSTFIPTEKDHAIIIWVYNNGKPAGRFTQTLPLSEGYFVPLTSHEKVLGVIGIQFSADYIFSSEPQSLLENFLSQISSTLERENLNKKTKKAMMVEESERLYKTLFNSISHELKTPLAIINGASSELLGQQENHTQIYAKEIFEASSRLNRLVENLLDMSRLESGQMKPKLEWCDLEELIGKVISDIKKRSEGFVFTINIQKKIPLMKLDFVLMEQALQNILNNSVLYAPLHSEIGVSATMKTGNLNLTIEDNGSGFPEESLPYIFGKFYRVPGTKTGGTGLGLAISKGWIEAHHGTIKVENKKNGGAKFTIIIPVETKTFEINHESLLNE